MSHIVWNGSGCIVCALSEHSASRIGLAAQTLTDSIERAFLSGMCLLATGIPNVAASTNQMCEPHRQGFYRHVVIFAETNGRSPAWIAEQFGLRIEQVGTPAAEAILRAKN